MCILANDGTIFGKHEIAARRLQAAREFELALEPHNCSRANRDCRQCNNDEVKDRVVDTPLCIGSGVLLTVVAVLTYALLNSHPPGLEIPST